MSTQPLDMTGTARAGWLARSAWAREHPQPAPRYAGPEHVDAAGLATVRDGPELLQLARELSLLAPAGLPRRTVLHLALAMLALAQDGTTTLPLDGAGRAALDRLLRAFDPESSTRHAIDTIVATRQVPIELAQLIGASGKEPLQFTGDTLALHRFSRLEDELARALAVQLALPPLEMDPQAVKAAFLEVAHSAGFTWTVDQQRALLNAAHLPFTVVSGGPGTGKTTIVVSLLRLLVRLGIAPVRIALAAPTGKAANRIYDEVRRQLDAQAQHLQTLGMTSHPLDVELLSSLPEPRTLHRLLDYSPSRDRFGADAVNPVEADVVVVDESSMVDIFLMERLFRACSQRTTGDKPMRLVLLGDANQLPSVEAGMVLHHLAQDTAPLLQPWTSWVLAEGKPSKATPVSSSSDPRARILTTLTWSHRMDPTRPEGKAIFDTAEAIRLGNVAALTAPGALAPPSRPNAQQLRFSHVEHLPAAATTTEMGRVLRDAFFPTWWQARFAGRAVRVGTDASVPLPSLWTRTFRFHAGVLHSDDREALRALLHASESQRVLCLTSGEAVEGAERSNAWFADRRRRWGQENKDRGGKGRFRAGDPVVFTVNDYTLRLFNGYSGVVAWTSNDGEKPRLRAIFEQPRGLQAYDLEQVHDRLVHAYAMTVHKAQGSQVECAALLLPIDENSPLLVRQLVYTAVSRASHSVVLVGEFARVVTASERPVERFSRVMERAEALMAR